MWTTTDKYAERKAEPQPIHVIWAIAFTTLFLATAAAIATSIASSSEVDSWNLKNVVSEFLTDGRGRRGANIPLTGTLAAMGAGGFGLLVAIALSYLTRRAPAGVSDEDANSAAVGQRALDISSVLYHGLKKFLALNLATVVGYTLIWAIVIGAGIDTHNDSWRTMFAFIGGVLMTVFSNVFGASTTTLASARALFALRREGVAGGVRVGFNAAAVRGLVGVSVGVISLGAWILILRDMRFLAGVAFGAASTALISRIWGAIFAKSAELAKEVNPTQNAIIADLIGDQVNNAVAASSDISESFVTAVAAAAILGTYPMGSDGTEVAFWLAAAAIVSNAVAVFTFRGGDVGEKRLDASNGNRNVIRLGIVVATALNIALGAIVIFYKDLGWRAYTAYVIGVAASVVLAVFTEAVTSRNSDNAKALATENAGKSLALGVAQGLNSTLFPAVLVFLTIFLPWTLGQNYEDKRRGAAEFLTAIAAIGFLSLAGVAATLKSFAAVADNVNGIAALADDDKSTLVAAAALDDIGKSGASLFRGYAAAGAILTAHVIVRCFVQATMYFPYEFARGEFWLTFPQTANVMGTVNVGIDFISKPALSEIFYNMDPLLLPEYTINLLDKRVLCGLFLGAVTPFVVAGLALDSAVQGGTIEENEGEAADERVAKLTSSGFLRTTIVLLFAIGLSIIILFAGGPYMTVAYLFAAIAVSFVLSTFLGNTGSAFDAARSYVAAGGNEPDSAPTDATVEAVATNAVTGQTLQDAPTGVFNTIVKFLAVFALVFAPPVVEVCKDLPVWESYCYSNRPEKFLARPTLAPTPAP